MHKYSFSITDLAGRPKPGVSASVTDASGTLETLWSDAGGLIPISNPVPANLQGLVRFYSKAGTVYVILSDVANAEVTRRTLTPVNHNVVFNPESELKYVTASDSAVVDPETGESSQTYLVREIGSTLINPVTPIDLRGLNAGDIIQTRGMFKFQSYDIVYSRWAMSMMVGDQVLWRYAYPGLAELSENGSSVVPSHLDISVSSMVVGAGSTMTFRSTGNVYSHMYDVYVRAYRHKIQHPALVSCNASITRDSGNTAQLRWENVSDFGTYSSLFCIVPLTYSVKILKV